MLKVTEKARKELKKLLIQYRNDGMSGLRLACKRHGQFGLVLSNETDGDTVVEYDDAKVLLVGKELTPILNGVTFDVNNDDGGREFVLFKK